VTNKRIQNIVCILKNIFITVHPSEEQASLNDTKNDRGVFAATSIYARVAAQYAVVLEQ
jgi:hypothetical protein